MIGSYLASGFFALAWLCVIAGIYFFKKSDKKLLGISWAVVSILASVCWHVFVAAMINLVGVPVNILSIAIADVVAGGMLWLFILGKKKGFQRYSYHVMDGVALLVMAAFALWYMYARTGGLALHISYGTIDPAPRFIEAMDVVNYQVVYGMFFQALTNGLLIEMISPLTSLLFYTRVFVLSDILFLFLGIWMFYACVRRYLKTPLLMGAGILASLFYTAVYPLNSTLFGFIYLGMGITLVAFLTFLIDSFAKEEIEKWSNVVLLMLGCLGIFVCYSMYVPIVFLALIAVVFVRQFGQKKLVSLDTVWVCLGIFLIPCILGLYYAFLGVFGAQDLSMGSALTNEGYSYRNLYSDFLPVLPLSIYGFIKSIGKKENHLQLFLFPFTSIFVVALFIGGMTGRVSSYYYYKTYNLLWFTLLFLMIVGFSYMKKETWILAGGQIAMWAVLLFVLLFSVEEKIAARNFLFVPNQKSGAFYEAFAYNRMLLQRPPYSQEKQDLYHYAYNELRIGQGEAVVPIVAFWEDTLWYHGITNQRYDEFGVSDLWEVQDIWRIDDLEDLEEMQERFQAQYAIVLTDETNQVYLENQEYFNYMEIIHGNDAGFIVRLTP